MPDSDNAAAPRDFDLKNFLPYMLNMAAEQASMGFRRTYKSQYGMTRTEWRVMFHLGRYGAMTARQICDMSSTHKTKISRAVKILETRRELERSKCPQDRRNEILTLTAAGQNVFDDLCGKADLYDCLLSARLTPEENIVLRRCLQKLMEKPG